jgi:hypothetical protein
MRRLKLRLMTLLVAAAIPSVVLWMFVMKEMAKSFAQAQGQHLKRQRHYELVLEVVELQLNNSIGDSKDRGSGRSEDLTLDQMNPYRIEELRRELSYHGTYQADPEQFRAADPEKSIIASSQPQHIRKLERDKENAARMVVFHKAMAQKYSEATKYPWLFFDPGAVP